VTKDEIDIGITYPDLAAIRNLVNISHGDYEKSYNAVIDNLNKSGGVNGRKLVPTFAPINPLGTAPAQEACLKLTEDQHMFAAVGFFINDSPLCYSEKHNTPVLGGTLSPELLASSKALWTTLDTGPEVTPSAIDTLTKSGVFKGGKVGVVTLVDDKTILDNTVLPALKRNGVTPTESAIIDAPTTDQQAVNDQTDTIMEKFKSEGIKTVLAVNNAPSSVITSLGKTDYRPRIASTSSTTLQAAASNPATDPSVLKTSVAADISIDFKDPALQSCFKIVQKATGDKIVEYPPTGTPEYRTSAQTACRYIALFAALAGAAGKNPTVASFDKAAAKVGSFAMPGSGTITYNPETHAWKQPMYTFKYDPSLKQMVIDKKIS
jgi:Periplasmic binding protein